MGDYYGHFKGPKVSWINLSIGFYRAFSLRSSLVSLMENLP